MGPAVRLRSAVALVGRFPVLAGVDLDVARGEVVLLRGANGAGKTSLLRACAGLVPIVSGTAEVLGCDLVVDRRAARRHTALYGHATGLYDDLSVLDNVRFAVRAARGPVSGVDDALATLGLTGRLRTAPVSTLSAGQRRRAALATLVARSPELWLLDEPHAGLDAEHRDLLDHLVGEAAKRGTTILLASHEHDRAEALAQRTVTVAGGMVTSDTVDSDHEAEARTTPTTPVDQDEPLHRSMAPGDGAVAEGRPPLREASDLRSPERAAHVG